MPRVNVIYHHFPHYRRPVMHALAQEGRHDYEFWGDTADHEGIKAFAGDDIVRVRPVRFRRGLGRTMDISGFWPAIRDPDADALIIIGNPNFRATWVMALAGRALGKKILFWSHGWLRPEPAPKRLIRNLYFGLADKVLLYGNRAAALAAQAGFVPSKLKVVYNSLDWREAEALYEQTRKLDRAALRTAFGMPERGRVLICTARLTAACQFDLLLKAASLLRERGEAYHIALVGDGPERNRLTELAKTLKVDVVFHGAIYDELVLAKLFAAADLTVSPGKIGLTAIHSLSHGVPVITHGDFNAQMPEVEAVQRGVTGDFFERGDAESLARTIIGWFERSRDLPALKLSCRRSIEARFTAHVQVRLIDEAVDEVLGQNA